MTIETDGIRRIIRDGVSINRDTLKTVLTEAVDEIETLRAKVRDQGYALEACGDARFVK